MHARTMRIPLKPFTLVGATTRPGMLSAPLRERFGIFHHLDFYGEDELTRIVARSAGILGVPIETEGAAEIARRSRGTPRIANRLLRRVRDFAQVKGDGRITLGVADASLTMEGVDTRGPPDWRFWAIVEHYDGGPVWLAPSLRRSTTTRDAAELVEPYLDRSWRTPSPRHAGGVPPSGHRREGPCQLSLE
jgi:Holliday junction DNA helicase RuvB